LTLYGYHNNYDSIQQKNIVVIGESEKFVQQLYSMGSKVGLATCGCDVSDVQAKHLKSLMTSKIILAYDEGLEEEQVRQQAQKLVLDNAVFRNKVGYIYDKDNTILQKGSKASPSDLGKDAFLRLMKDHVVWLK
jgi:DNA primase